jgi:hypothetical protein
MKGVVGMERVNWLMVKKSEGMRGGANVCTRWSFSLNTLFILILVIFRSRWNTVA